MSGELKWPSKRSTLTIFRTVCTAVKYRFERSKSAPESRIEVGEDRILYIHRGRDGTQIYCKN